MISPSISITGTPVWPDFSISSWAFWGSCETSISTYSTPCSSKKRLAAWQYVHVGVV